MASRKRLLAANLAFQTDAAEIADVWEQALLTAKRVELTIKEMNEAGMDGATVASVCQAVYEPIDVEIQLLKAKQYLAGK